MVYMKQWQIYQDAHGEWRWWQLDDEGNIERASETGFSSKSACEDNASEFGYVTA